MQQIFISGFLSRDAEQRQTQKGDSVTTWNVPVRQGWGDAEQTNWYRVSIWGKRADFAAKSRKGDFVTVTGELTIGEYQGKPQYEIRASDFQAITPKPRDPDGSRGHAQQEPAESMADDLGDEIPFVTSAGIW